MNTPELNPFVPHEIDMADGCPKARFSYDIIHRRASPLKFPDDRGLSPIAYDI